MSARTWEMHFDACTSDEKQLCFLRLGTLRLIRSSSQLLRAVDWTHAKRRMKRERNEADECGGLGDESPPSFSRSQLEASKFPLRAY